MRMYRPTPLTAVLTGLAVVLGLALPVAPASASAGQASPARHDDDRALPDVLQNAVEQGSPGALAQSRTGSRARDAAAGVADNPRLMSSPPGSREPCQPGRVQSASTGGMAANAA